jgi:hypothetical protein
VHGQWRRPAAHLAREIQIDRHIGEGGDREVDRIADGHGPRWDAESRPAAEGDRPIRLRHNPGFLVTQRDVSAADVDRRGAEGIAQDNPDAAASD